MALLATQAVEEGQIITAADEGGIGDGSVSGNERTSSTTVTGSSRARARWLLALTLYRNPSVQALRHRGKRQLEAPRPVLGSNSVSVRSNDKANDNDDASSAATSTSRTNTSSAYSDTQQPTTNDTLDLPKAENAPTSDTFAVSGSVNGSCHGRGGGDGNSCGGLAERNRRSVSAALVFPWESIDTL
jgi:hypothetical protein